MCDCFRPILTFLLLPLAIGVATTIAEIVPLVLLVVVGDGGRNR